MNQALEIPGLPPIKLKNQCRILGVISDSTLRWNAHLQYIKEKSTNILASLGSLAGSMWGTGYQGLRQIYLSVALPQILYACSAWYSPNENGVTY
jgi:hypothetical protein